MGGRIFFPVFENVCAHVPKYYAVLWLLLGFCYYLDALLFLGRVYYLCVYVEIFVLFNLSVTHNLNISVYRILF
jgi:hypothetical protein